MPIFIRSRNDGKSFSLRIADAKQPLPSLHHRLQAAYESLQHLAQAYAGATGQPIGFDESSCFGNIRALADQLSPDDRLRAQINRVLTWRAREEALFDQGKSGATLRKVQQAVACATRVHRAFSVWWSQPKHHGGTW